MQMQYLLNKENINPFVQQAGSKTMHGQLSDKHMLKKSISTAVFQIRLQTGFYLNFEVPFGTPRRAQEQCQIKKWQLILLPP